MERNDIIVAPNSLPDKKEKFYIFLAGPIQGAENWQHSVPEIENVIWLSPRRYTYNNWDHSEWVLQTEWEELCMRIADIIMFWIPNETEHLEWRQYAQTTRTEFGEYMTRGKKLVVGIEDGFPGREYLATKLTRNCKKAPYYTLDECLSEVKEFVQRSFSGDSREFYTSDTHFSSDRTLKLSKRPFSSVQEMDWYMIQKWNDTVSPFDTVYHLGDFGDLWPLQYLNGHIHFIKGNYERDGKSECPEEGKHVESVHDLKIETTNYLMAHEPTIAQALNTNGKFILFGHIHGRQKVKPFGIDVGVDCNNFTPVSKEEVDFYKNAIEKGYYDFNVWQQDINSQTPKAEITFG